LNVFDLDKPGREKLAKMNATLMGKEKVRAISWSAKRAEIYSGHADGSITCWNAVEGKPIYVLKAFDNEITKVEFIIEKDLLICCSKAKQIKVYKLPKEWRDAKLVADEQKLASKLVIEYNKQKVSNAVQKAAEDSDDDDLAGWHLD
jgi:WD40 repeat protein